MNPFFCRLKFFINLIITSVFFVYFSSCSSPKKIQTSQNPQYFDDSVFNVILTIKIKIPYCGGAAPTREMLNRTASEKNAGFYLIYQNGCGDSLWKREFSTDSLGKIRLYLPAGKYCLKRTAKNIPFEEFYKFHKKENDNFNIYGTKECYYKWWKSCNYSFETANEHEIKEIEIILPSRCFTGENPCQEYIGPYPP